MLKSYWITALRHLRKNKTWSFINISGLAVGMAVAMLIGLWIGDEWNFDRFPEHFDRIAEVRQNRTFSNTIKTGRTVPVPLAAELQHTYGNDFRYIVLASWTDKHILSTDDKVLMQSGNFMGSDAPRLFSLTMLKGSHTGLQDPSSILLSQTAATALFGKEDPMGRTIRLDNDKSLTVTGVYQDFPNNSSFRSLSFIGAWEFFAKNTLHPRSLTDWWDDSFGLYVQLADNADMATVSARIKNVKLQHAGTGSTTVHPQLFLHPMSRWHLYSEFTNGVNTGGRILYVWLFGIIGIFVLLLACINFMNLSTARSERRAREVGIRKAIGSRRGQLIGQFFGESLVTALIAFVLAIALVWLLLPFFNGVAGKKIAIQWTHPLFWLLGLGFAMLTGLLAGSYPALYLSSFRPVKVLTGIFKAGPNASIPRKVLIVLQFSVSVILIIGTLVVFQQIRYAKDRPVGYTRNGLVSVAMTTNDLFQHYDAVKDDLLRSGAVSNVALSNSSTTGVSFFGSKISWEGKDPATVVDFAMVGVTHEYGKTVGWEFKEGRDFSGSFATDDSTAVVLNEAAVKVMGLKQPVGAIIQSGDKDLRVIGVIRDMVMESPYDPVKQTIFYVRKKFTDDFLNIRINPHLSAAAALSKIGDICKTYSPSAPFVYKFADEEYARKFSDEERIGKLASFFAALAIFISCLGLFGMASFMAEQRIKEIGVRKILGASVLNLWGLLSKDFVVLVALSLLIALPVARYVMSNWLQQYHYRSGMPWWIFALTSVGTLLITLATVSYQSIKAARANPVHSLRSQ